MTQKSTGNETIDELDILDGAVKLYRRNIRGEFNPVWQAIIKTPSSTGRIRKSLKTKSLDEAKRLAREEYMKAEARVQTGLPLNPIRFDTACLEYKRWLKQQNEAGAKSDNLIKQHISIIESALKPFFKETYLHNIKTRDIEAYHAQRTRKGTTRLGAPVRAGTKNRDNAIIRAIFKYCIREGYIKEAPMIDNHSAFVQRPSFTRDEMKELQNKLAAWVSLGNHESQSQHITDYRKLFKLYCMIIYYSGIRPGREMASLRWENIQYKTEQGISWVQLSVETSKQKKAQRVVRSVVAMPDLKEYIEELKETPHLAPKQGWVFQHPDTTQLNKSHIGTQIRSFKSQWKRFIEWSGLELEKSPPYRRRSLYSLRHAYFETRLVYGDVSLVELAINGGTSPEVIMKWYQEAKAPQFAMSLASVIRRENNST